ncbi:MAG: energy-coupling factor transporter ATPase [Lachnospiraceae bacterium]|nr:energy-coupling factor transporter ATPase [Lachnospiraceae bacterium]
MAIELRDVNYIYDPDSTLSYRALEDINLILEDGVFYALIGHTGSGKSTLIQHMNGLVKPTSGQVLYEGKNIADKSMDLRELRSNVGLVFQYPEHQLFETTVYADVSFGPKNLKLSKEEIDIRVKEALKLAGVDESLWEVSPFELSGGQKRRVAIAGVLAMKPKVLILDEPTAGLDPGGRDEILNVLRNLHDKEGITILLVSHSMEDVAGYADRIIVMNKGRIMYNDVPDEIFAHAEELKEMGLSVPQVTSVLSALKNKGFDISDNITKVDKAADEIIRVLGLENKGERNG